MISAVAVIDIGSNSIKALLAQSTSDGTLHARYQRSIEARISAGISQREPRLTEDGLQRGLAAVQTLLTDLAPFQPDATVLVATSAVRDARNGDDFCARVHAATGHTIRILTGEEEATLIGRGLTCDPALRDLRDFYVFDLGGGSLECLVFRHRELQRKLSLPLGCVRLTERFIPDPSAAVPPAAIAAISAHVNASLETASFAFQLPADAVAVGTGGTLTTVRTIRAARVNEDLEATDSLIPLGELIHLRDELSALPLEERRRIGGLPPARADVFPAALATLVAVAESGGLGAFRHSLYNLRWGLAAAAFD
ncbi:Ppx/GppA phosphatase family protein [Horticoccus luteus]|uniref:Ppx/GppA phosphatase family protein n=1 Tax=Horticoccus luteus TaxID=2862869 RepID=UPI0021080591|nr:phosphatase [Horticoccus luteus]